MQSKCDPPKRPPFIHSPLPIYTYLINAQDNNVDVLLVSVEGNPNAEAAAKVKYQKICIYIYYTFVYMCVYVSYICV